LFEYLEFSFSDPFFVNVSENRGDVCQEPAIVGEDETVGMSIGVDKVPCETVFNPSISRSSHVTDDEHDLLLIVRELRTVPIDVKRSLSEECLELATFSLEWFRWVDLSLVTIILHNHLSGLNGC
jgi:hypothetical protein